LSHDATILLSEKSGVIDMQALREPKKQMSYTLRARAGLFDSREAERLAKELSMRRLLAVGVIAFMTASIAVAQEGAKAGGAKAAGGGVAQALIDMENQWGKAAKAGDGDAVGAMLATDFVMLDSDGSLHTKADVVARTKKSKWVTNEIADVKVVAHGDSAIVTGTWIGKGTDATGKAVDAKERWADTWVKAASGKWQCVASASAPMK
jgi:ketosteroid isomerase-like protein